MRSIKSIQQGLRKKMMHFWFGSSPATKNRSTTTLPSQNKPALDGGKTGGSTSEIQDFTVSWQGFLNCLFFDQLGILHIDFLHERSTINAAYYCEPLIKVRDAFATKYETNRFEKWSSSMITPDPILRFNNLKTERYALGITWILYRYII